MLIGYLHLSFASYNFAQKRGAVQAPVFSSRYATRRIISHPSCCHCWNRSSMSWPQSIVGSVSLLGTLQFSSDYRVTSWFRVVTPGSSCFIGSDYTHFLSVFPSQNCPSPSVKMSIIITFFHYVWRALSILHKSHSAWLTSCTESVGLFFEKCHPTHCTITSFLHKVL